MTFDHENRVYYNQFLSRSWTSPGSGDPSRESSLWTYQVSSTIPARSFDAFIWSLTFDPSDYSIYHGVDSDIGRYSLTTGTSQAFASLSDGFHRLSSLFTNIDKEVLILAPEASTGDVYLLQLDKTERATSVVTQLDRDFYYMAAMAPEPDDETVVTSIEEEAELPELNVFPNPIDPGLQLQVEGLQGKVALIKLQDLLGRPLKSYAVKGADSALLDLGQGLPAKGLYLLVMRGENGRALATKKLLIGN